MAPMRGLGLVVPGLILFSALAQLLVTPAVAITTERTTQLVADAERAFQKRDYRKAYLVFGKADRAARGQSREAASGLAKASLHVGRFGEARQAAETVLKLTEEGAAEHHMMRVQAWNALGVALYAEAVETESSRGVHDRLVAAEHAFNEVLRLSVGQAHQAHYNLAEVLAARHQHGAALASFERYRERAREQDETAAVKGLECYLRYRVAGETAAHPSREAVTQREAATPGATEEADVEVVPPKKLSSPSPDRNELARANGVYGTVVLSAIIDRTGSIKCLRVLKGLPLGLTEDAFRAVEDWRFEPARVGRTGEPVEVEFRLRINFR